MRNIKFRTWHKKEKKMYKPLLLERTLGVDSISDCHNEDVCKSPIWMQFTGLKDKNGKDIYESDIVFTGSNYILVEMLEGYWSVASYKTDTALEIIGNIHKNPELLK